MTTVYLIRHGETANNKQDCYNGCRSDQPLSERGVLQAQHLAAALAEVPFEAIYCSPLIRAVQTAEILRGTRPMTLTVNECIREMDMGDFDGVSYEEVRRRRPDISANWNKNPDAVKMPGGESFAEALARSLPAVLAIIRASRDKTVAVVAHGTLLRLLMAALLGLPLSRKAEMDNLCNTGYYRISVTDDGQVTLEASNECAHLPRELLPTWYRTPAMTGARAYLGALKG